MTESEPTKTVPPAAAGRAASAVRGAREPRCAAGTKRHAARGVRDPGPRERRFDAAVLAYLAHSPQATVVALGEGLGTGFWRLDNGRLTWLTVQPPETAAMRRMLLPDGPRRRTAPCAVTDHRWLDAVPQPDRGVVVVAPGVLMRMPPPAVRALLAACAERFPDGALVFDVLPRRATALVRWCAGLSGGRWPDPSRWGLDRADLPRVASAHPGITGVRELPLGRGWLKGPVSWRPARLPGVRAVAPLVVEVRFAAR
ncbi:class I SAM-dependent methyltransferase [Streptomyces sp. NPDC017993]|uniref:class I SAM-dependent methyltransferase n=1 Tax=Streptomyces sp. NPDC017993 TaxID=3365027 RepID=UPI0037943691